MSDRRVRAFNLYNYNLVSRSWEHKKTTGRTTSGGSKKGDLSDGPKAGPLLVFLARDCNYDRAPGPS